MQLDYICPNCESALFGGFGEDIYCNTCRKIFETDWDYFRDSIGCWITKEIIMTQKEKAKELIDRFYIYAAGHEHTQLMNAKKCAVLLAQELINYLPEYCSPDVPKECLDEYSSEWWKEVITEIQNYE